jgi:hypothetical protein
MKKSLLFTSFLIILFHSISFSQQKPPIKRSVATQVVQDRALQALEFIKIPHGVTPSFPAYVPDSLKCGSLFYKVTPGDTSLYIYNCLSNLWQKASSQMALQFYKNTLQDTRNLYPRIYYQPTDTSNSNQYVATYPKTIGKRIIALGSSSVNNTGPASPTNGLGYNWAALTQARGYQFINEGIGGTNSVDEQNRLFSDFKNLKGDYLLLGTSSANDIGRGGDINQWFTYKLASAKEAQRVGVVPVWFSPYAFTAVTNATLYAQYLDIMDAVEARGYPMIDVIHNIGDPNNNYAIKTPFNVDNTHVNDLGQTVGFKPALDPTIFDVLHNQIVPRKSLQPMSWKLIAKPATGAMTMPTDQPLYNWTISASIKGDPNLTPPESNGFYAQFVFSMTTTTGAVWRLKYGQAVTTQGGEYLNYFIDGSTSVMNQPASLNPTNDDYRHLTLTCSHDGSVQTFTLYVDGVQVGQTTTSNIAAVTAFTFFSRSDGLYPFRNEVLAKPTIYRYAMRPDEVKRLYRGDLPATGLLLYSRLNTQPGYWIPNEAETGIRGTIPMGIWAQTEPFILNNSVAASPITQVKRDSLSRIHIVAPAASDNSDLAVNSNWVKNAIAALGTVTSITSTTGDIVVANGTTTPAITLTTVNGKPLSYFDPTSSIQTQLNGKGTVSNVSSATTDIAVTNPTTTPSISLNNVNGITKAYYDPTSSIQTQLNAKANSAAPSFTGIATSTGNYRSTFASITGLAAFEARSSSPRYFMQNTSAGTDAKIWDLVSYSSDGTLHLRASNDADNATNDAMTITRTGNTVTGVTFPTATFVPTAAAGTSNTQAANTAFVLSSLNNDYVQTLSAAATIPVNSTSSVVNLTGTTTTTYTLPGANTLYSGNVSRRITLVNTTVVSHVIALTSGDYFAFYTGTGLSSIILPPKSVIVLIPSPINTWTPLNFVTLNNPIYTSSNISPMTFATEYVCTNNSGQTMTLPVPDPSALGKNYSITINNISTGTTVVNTSSSSNVLRINTALTNTDNVLSGSVVTYSLYYDGTTYFFKRQ